jgi:hypothetical protein
MTVVCLRERLSVEVDRGDCFLQLDEAKYRILRCCMVDPDAVAEIGSKGRDRASVRSPNPSVVKYTW